MPVYPACRTVASHTARLVYRPIVLKWLILVELMRINFDMYMLLRFPFLTRLYFVVCSQAKILCSNMCKCVGCKNFEESPDRKTLMHLADAAEVRVQQQTAAKTKLSSQMQDIPMRTLPPSTGEK